MSIKTIGDLLERLREIAGEDDSALMELPLMMAHQPNWPLRYHVAAVEVHGGVVYIVEGDHPRGSPYAPKALWDEPNELVGVSAELVGETRERCTPYDDYVKRIGPALVVLGEDAEDKLEKYLSQHGLEVRAGIEELSLNKAELILRDDDDLDPE